MTALPMFPLGTVLLPGSILPLHVFEPRYLELLHHCLEHAPEFGVVLITEGHEVGGTDQRSAVGTVARIVEAMEASGGRWMVSTIGTRRIRVDRWLPAEPYPLAEVQDWPDGPAEAGIEDLLGVAVGLLRNCLARQTELGEDVIPATFDVPEDPTVASYLLTSAASLDASDSQRLLEAPDPTRRLEDLVGVLRARLAVLDRAIGHH